MVTFTANINTPLDVANGSATILPLEIFTQIKFVADFI